MPPSDDETAVELYNAIATLMETGATFLPLLDAYGGCADSIREAMSAPSNMEKQTTAFNALLPNVAIIKSFYDFSRELGPYVNILLFFSFSLTPPAEAWVPRLLNVLVNHDALQAQQALAKQLADVLAFVLTFDQAKMTCPALQNDFSYYRRTLSKMRNHPSVTVSEAEANRISMFIAENIPMMKVCDPYFVRGFLCLFFLSTTQVLATSASSVFRENRGIIDTLAGMANVCCNMVHSRRFTNEDTNIYCLRAMTGAIVLYDHVDPLGAFHGRSPIKIKKCIQQLKVRQGATPQGLQNTLKYCTMTFTKDSTPGAIRALLE